MIYATKSNVLAKSLKYLKYSQHIIILALSYMLHNYKDEPYYISPDPAIKGNTLIRVQSGLLEPILNISKISIFRWFQDFSKNFHILCLDGKPLIDIVYHKGFNLVVSATPVLVEHLTDLKNGYVKYDLNDFYHLTERQSFLIYESYLQYKKLGKTPFLSIEDFAISLGIYHEDTKENIDNSTIIARLNKWIEQVYVVHGIKIAVSTKTDLNSKKIIAYALKFVGQDTIPKLPTLARKNGKQNLKNQLIMAGFGTSDLTLTQVVVKALKAVNRGLVKAREVSNIVPVVADKTSKFVRKSYDELSGAIRQFVFTQSNPATKTNSIKGVNPNAYNQTTATNLALSPQEEQIIEHIFKVCEFDFTFDEKVNFIKIYKADKVVRAVVSANTFITNAKKDGKPIRSIKAVYQTAIEKGWGADLPSKDLIGLVDSVLIDIQEMQRYNDQDALIHQQAYTKKLQQQKIEEDRQRVQHLFEQLDDDKKQSFWEFIKQKMPVFKSYIEKGLYKPSDVRVLHYSKEYFAI